jgi:hypothetical protein
MTYDVYVDEDISIKADVDEYYQLILHMDVQNWNGSVCKKAKRLGTYMKEAFRLEGFETAYTVTPNPKFVKLVFGGTSKGTLVHENIEYEVVAWDLRQQR